jgi:alanine racemase
MLDSIIRETERRGIMQYPIHIKLDTGMNRLGFDAKDISSIIEKLDAQQGVFVRSVFSHLAGSDSSSLDYYTETQIKLFSQLSHELERALAYPVWKHLLNSAGIERFPEYQFDMVRLGIGLYGISSMDEKALKPVATLKTRILQIRNVKEGESVGYNRNQVLERNSRIACLPIGYADGLDRRLGNGHFSVSVNGQLCPLVGNICMDICMIDITDIIAEEADEVIIFGEERSVFLLAKTLDTIPYEILTSISPRVKRIYYKE